MLAQSRYVSAGATRAEHKIASRDFPQRAKKSAPTRVLVVVDEALVRWSVTETLAASAIRAFSAPAASTDVVLLDLRLPDADGLGVLLAMRRLSSTTPVILMTAYGTPEVLDEALQIGAFSVVIKPFDMKHLTSLVERALGGRPR